MAEIIEFVINSNFFQGIGMLIGVIFTVLVIAKIVNVLADGCTPR